MPNNEESEAAFRALAETVADMEGRGKSTRTAGVKPQLSRRLGVAFSERTLGFQTFGAFARAAADAGFVNAVTDADGWFSLESISGTTPAERPRRRENERLRPDIWRAFTEWGDGWIRVWDRASARAIRLPEKAQLNESHERSELRSALEAGSDGAILIQPIPQEAQLEWLREFVGEIGDHPLSAPLKASLSDPRPFKTVSLVLRADTALRHRLHALRASKVMAAVRAWAAEHSVDLDSVDDSSEDSTTDAEGHAALAGSGDVERLRLALHRAIDQMSLEDLRLLRVPAGLLLDALR